MNTTFAELLTEARSARRAVASFTAYDLGTGAAIIRGAEDQNVGVIVIVSPQAFAASTGQALVAGLAKLAERTSAPVCLQLDHATDLGLIEVALDAGVGAVMADGSRLPFAENVEFVGAAVELAARYGAGAEAELGRIEGNEESAVATTAAGLTDPAEAERFVSATSVACLAVSIGNVHGAYARYPDLDWPRLEEIAATVEVPLSLHGASGLDADDLRRGIERGVTKINVNTELRQSWFQATERELPTHAGSAQLLALQGKIEDALYQTVTEKIRVLS